MPYKYKESIEIKLQQFDKYLRSKNYSIDTIRQNRNYAGLYLEWLEGGGLKSEEVGYKELSDFIFRLKEKVTTGHLRRIILAVQHYYRSLGIDRNPASGIYIRGHRKSILNDTVSYKELELLYQKYQVLDDRTKRNKVILGILIYQGLTTAEVHQLEPSHIQLKESKIHVSGTSHTKSRVLDIAAVQLLDLQEYLLEIRPRMLENVNGYRSGRKVEKVDPIIYDKLFFSERGSANIKTSLYHMFRGIRRTYPKVTSGKVIRSTVLAEWLKTKDIRVVQYMAGHRWVSSTERYNVFNLQELKDSLGKYHPMK